MAETFYEVLGVEPDAGESAIDAAFRERIKDVHPDVNDDPAAEERSRRLIEAREVLTDEGERARYDRLGHEQYVRQADIDASWASDVTGSRSPTASDETEATADTAGGGSTGAGSTWAGRSGWRQRRRRRGHQSRHARQERRDAGVRESDRQEDSAGGSTAGRAKGASGDTAGSGAGGDPTTDAGAESSSPEQSSSVGTSGNVGGPVGWATSGDYAVRDEPARTAIARSRLFPPSQSLVLLVAAFFSYPGLVFGSVFPGFSPLVNVIVAACTLAVIVYLASMPEVGIYVFGGWTVLGTFGVFASTVDPISIVGLLVLGSTWLPLGLSLLTHWALRW